MNDVVVELDMRSYEDCRKRIRSFDKVIRGAAMRGIKSSAVNVLGDSQRNIKAHDSIATAQLINSGKTKSSMSGQYVDVIYNVIQAFLLSSEEKQEKYLPMNPYFNGFTKGNRCNIHQKRSETVERSKVCLHKLENTQNAQG